MTQIQRIERIETPRINIWINFWSIIATFLWLLPVGFYFQEWNTIWQGGHIFGNFDLNFTSHGKASLILSNLIVSWMPWYLYQRIQGLFGLYWNFVLACCSIAAVSLAPNQYVFVTDWKFIVQACSCGLWCLIFLMNFFGNFNFLKENKEFLFGQRGYWWGTVHPNRFMRRRNGCIRPFVQNSSAAADNNKQGESNVAETKIEEV